MTNKRSLKQRGEDAAAAYLERVGICVAERSWRTDAGVIDIIGLDGDVLVLADVKTHKGCPTGSEPALSASVRRRINKLAQAYIEYADLENVKWRLDRVDLLVISEDRALLRHHREVLTSTD